MVCRRFGTLYQFHLQGLDVKYEVYFILYIQPLKMELLHNLHPALEDGTDRGFRNVGKPQSDAGEIPKKNTYKTINFVMSVFLSACPSVSVEQLGSYLTDLYEIWYYRIYRKSFEKIQVSLDSDKTNGYFT